MWFVVRLQLWVAMAATYHALNVALQHYFVDVVVESLHRVVARYRHALTVVQNMVVQRDNHIDHQRRVTRNVLESLRDMLRAHRAGELEGGLDVALEAALDEWWLHVF